MAHLVARLADASPRPALGDFYSFGSSLAKSTTSGFSQAGTIAGGRLSIAARELGEGRTTLVASLHRW
jgi:hypothetical protein